MSYYKIENLEEYFKHYKKSIREPKKFWDRIASENFTWYQEWDNVIDFNMAEAEIKWFTNAKVNITKTVSTDTLQNEAIKRLLFLSRTILQKQRNIFRITNYTNAFLKWRMSCVTKASKKEIASAFIYQ